MVVTLGVLMLAGRTITTAGWMANAFPLLAKLG